MYLIKMIVIAVSLVTTCVAQAQKFPDHPIHVISAFPPAGGVDIAARIVGAQLAKRIGQSVIIENRPGAAGVVGTTVVAHARPDGYTILITANSSITIMPQLSKVDYDPEKDLIPIAKIGVAPTILVVRAASPLHSLKDLLREGRQASSRVSIGVPGWGSTGQIELTHLSHLVKSQIGIVPYRGAAFIVTDVLGGHVTGGAFALPASVPQIKSGKMRGLAVFSPNRSPILPNVPTAREATGLTLDVFPTWYGFFAPAGTPPDVITRLETNILAVMKEPSVIAKLKKAGTQALLTGSVAFAKENKVEAAAVKRVIKEDNIQAQ